MSVRLVSEVIEAFAWRVCQSLGCDYLDREDGVDGFSAFIKIVMAIQTNQLNCPPSTATEGS
jgi:hypothetical protein